MDNFYYEFVKKTGSGGRNGNSYTEKGGIKPKNSIDQNERSHVSYIKYPDFLLT
jgi:hypothetical protein